MLRTLPTGVSLQSMTYWEGIVSANSTYICIHAGGEILLPASSSLQAPRCLFMLSRVESSRGAPIQENPTCGRFLWRGRSSSYEQQR